MRESYSMLAVFSWRSRDKAVCDAIIMPVWNRSVPHDGPQLRPVGGAKLAGPNPVRRLVFLTDRAAGTGAGPRRRPRPRDGARSVAGGGRRWPGRPARSVGQHGAGCSAGTAVRVSRNRVADHRGGDSRQRAVRAPDCFIWLWRSFPPEGHPGSRSRAGHDTGKPGPWPSNGSLGAQPR